MNRRRNLLLLAVGVTLALALFLLRNSPPTRQPQATNPEELAEEIPFAPPTLRAKDASPPLPPQDAPLATTVPALVARAEAGDSRAACRLGMELLRCEQMEQWNRITVGSPDSESQFESEGNLGAANFQAEEKIWRIERLAQCATVPAGLRDQGSAYLRQAAYAGDPHAMQAYAEGLHFNLEMRGSALDPHFDAWRRDSPAMMHAALRAGNPTAAFSLFSAYQDDHGPFTALVPDDTFQAAVFHLLSVRLFGMSDRMSTFTTLDATGVANAYKEAEALHQRYFGGRRFDQSRALGYPAHVAPSPGREARAFCE
jgi:hypothetical protein